MDSYDTLVIILAVALAVSLLVWIIVGTLAIQVLKRLRTASDTAQQAVENVEEFTEQLKNAGKMSTVGSAVAQISKIFKGKGR